MFSKMFIFCELFRAVKPPFSCLPRIWRSQWVVYGQVTEKEKFEVERNIFFCLYGAEEKDRMPPF